MKIVKYKKYVKINVIQSVSVKQLQTFRLSRVHFDDGKSHSNALSEMLF